MTSRFCELNRERDILAEIAEALKIRYPSYTYRLLLSRDYETDPALPVKLIEYSDEDAKEASTQAFMTGELQLESCIEEGKTFVYVPLAGEQAVYGVLQLITPTIVSFSNDELTFMTRFADAAGKALENVALYRYSRQLAGEMKMINDIIHELNSNLNLPEIISILKLSIVEASQPDEIAFIDLQKEGSKEEIALPGSTAFFDTEAGLSFIRQMIEKLAKDKKAMFCGDFNTISPFPFRSLIAIPMILSGELHGLVVIMHRQPYFFSFDTFNLMQSIARHATLAITNAALKNRLETMVVTDYLTRLYSRNYLDKQIRNHMETADLGTLILLDIDDFKQINDRFGHDVGDKVIKQVADVIRQHNKEYDIPARWGGEEFAFYMPGVSIDKGSERATLIRKQAATSTIPPITLSSGVSAWDKGTVDSAQALFIRADKALYKAKESGKNCVVEESRED